MKQRKRNNADNLRNQNIELLRAYACISVVLLHVNAWCFEIEKLTRTMRLANVIVNTLVRFAVPCFMLITGKYVFQNLSKHGVKCFYKKTIKKVIIPTLGFSIMYVVYTVLKGLLSNEWLLKDEMYKWLNGIPFGHMWYMYMLIGFYFIVPLLNLARKNIPRRIWGIIGVGCVFLGSIFYNGNLVAPYWFFCWIQYVGYFILGDFAGGGKTNQSAPVFVWITCIISLIAMCLYSLKIGMMGIRYDFQPQNILTAVYSVSVFIIFDNLKISKMPTIVEKIAKQSANIYYIHGLVVNIVVIIMNQWGLQYVFPALFLIFTVVAVLIVSYMCGVCVDYTTRFFDKVNKTMG